MKEKGVMSRNSVITNISIADMVIEVQGHCSVLDLPLDGVLDRFLGVSPKPVRRLFMEWQRSDEELQPEGELVYDPGAVWRMYASNDSWCAEITYALDHRATMSKEVNCLLYANPEWDAFRLVERNITQADGDMFFLGACELIVRTSIVMVGGLMLHASPLDDNGRGIAFCGPSGMGKSTQLRLWEGEKGVLAMSDDRVVVGSDENGRKVCYGTPWGSKPEIALNASAPLNALVILEQSSANGITELSSPTAATRVTCRAFLPFWDKGLMKMAFKNLNEIVNNVPVYLLRFREEPSVVDIVRSVL